MEKTESFKIVIVGSGFVGQTISNELDNSNLRTALIDISPMVISFGPEEQKLYSSEQLRKTANPEGGVSVWGRALTLPIEGEYFGDPRFENWNNLQIQRYFDRATSYFGVPLKKFNLSKRSVRIMRSVLPSLEQSFSIESHCYASMQGGKSGWSRRGERTPLFSGEVTIISRITNGWEIELRTTLGTKKIRTEKLVFAAGAIGNAVLAFIATGISGFSIGNHTSSRVGTLKLDRPRKFNELANTFKRSDPRFITISIPREKELPSVGIRFQATGAESYSGSMADQMKTRLRNWAALFLSVFNIWQKFSIRLMLETSGRQLQSLTISKDSGSFTGSVRSEISSEEQFQVGISLRALSQYFEFTKHSISLDSNNNLTWSDAAHYFGTLPMEPERADGGLVVDQNYMLVGQEGLYAVGASAFSRGSHGHPTFLAVCLGLDFSDKIKNSYLRKNA